MNVDGSRCAVSAVSGHAADAAANARLKEVCRDMEGVFLSMLMKEGLKSMIEGENDSSHASALLETTVEQVANQMAGTESLGIARMLYEQVSGAAATRERNSPCTTSTPELP